MRLGIGLGLFKAGLISAGVRIFSAFQTRVIGDGGTVEAGTCVVNGINGSALLQQASLLLIPSGYKGGKLYAEIPTNGNGDLTWTRGSEAFRTNASGLIQRVPWNLLQYSEQFDNSAWIKNNATITSNAINAPNGTLTADKLVETTANGVHNAVFVLSPNVTTYTASFYAKAAERNFVYYSFGGPSWGGQGFMVNLTTGAVSQNTTGATPTITLLPDGWVKIEASRAAVSTTQIQFQIFTGLDSTTFSYTGDSTKGIFIWGAQLVEGTTAQTYLPTTDRLNFPRLSYMYGSCPALLLEPQRTNLALQSQDFDNAYWGKQSGATVTANTTTSPDGTTNADTINLVSGSTISRVEKAGIAYSASTSYTLSFYFKNIALTSGQTFAIRIEGSGGFDLVGTIDLFNNTNSVSLSGTAGSGFVSSSQRATYDILANGWVRCSIGLTTGTNTGTATVYIISNVNANRSFYAYGAQLEAGAYPTTYIPTTSATATRVADSFSRSNIYTNGLISASGGTWFVELRGNVVYTRDNSNFNINLDDSGGFNNGFVLRNSTVTGRLSIQKVISGAATTLYTTTTDTTKIAIKWNGSTADVFVNGVKQVSATAFTTVALQNLITGIQVPTFIQQMALYPTPLSDTDCTTLTTL